MHSYLTIDHLCGKAREKTRGGGTDDSVSLTTQHTGLAVNRPHVGRGRTTLDSFGHLTLSGGSDRTVWACGLAAASRSHSRTLISDRPGKRERRLRLHRPLDPPFGVGEGEGGRLGRAWARIAGPCGQKRQGGPCLAPGGRGACRGGRGLCCFVGEKVSLI